MLDKKANGAMNLLSYFGLAFLVLASFFKMKLAQMSGWPETLTDGAAGLLYGVAIGFLLLGLVKARRRRSM